MESEKVVELLQARCSWGTFGDYFLDEVRVWVTGRAGLLSDLVSARYGGLGFGEVAVGATHVLACHCEGALVEELKIREDVHLDFGRQGEERAASRGHDF